MYVCGKMGYIWGEIEKVPIVYDINGKKILSSQQKYYPVGFEISIR